MMNHHRLNLSIVLIMFASLIVGSTAANAAEPRETVLQRVRRIVGGRRINIHSAPYMMNIRRNGWFQCGGSLLTRDCVLTAAHCARDAEPEDFTVRGGVTYLDQRRNVRNVADIFIPPTYNSKILDNDVAIFKLARPMRDNVTGIQTIRLSETDPEPGEVVEVYGWGLPHEHADHPSYQLKSVQLRVMERDKCIEKYRNYRSITESMFCTMVSPERDACSADSGGPAVVDGEVVGIVSWGRGRECGRTRSPGVYVNVAHLRPWIMKTLDQHCL